MKKLIALLLVSITVVVLAGTNQVDNLAVSGSQTVGANVTAATLTATGNAIVGGTLTNANESITGKTLSYNGDTTVGNGIGAIVGSAALTAQAASIAATTVYTTTAAGEFMLCPYTMCTTAGSGGTVSITMTWTDENGAQSLAVASAFSVSVQGVSIGAVRSIHCSSAAAIKYTTTYTGTGGAQYAFYVTVVRLR